MNLLYEAEASALRPREKLRALGPASLSDLELIQLLLGSGCRQASVAEVALRCRTLFDRSGVEVDEAAWLAVPGLGPAKAALMTAAAELVRRWGRPSRLLVRNPSDLVPRLQHWTDRPQEVFLTVTLNGAQEVTGIRPVTLGLLNRTLVHPREVFAPALADRAASVILAHTHPSGSLDPSREDKEATVRLVQAGRLLGIEVLDHLIVTTGGYYSFREQGVWGI